LKAIIHETVRIIINRMITSENTNKATVCKYNMTSKEINPNDVLCGRGGLTNSHVGTKRFRCVVAEYQLEYLKARKNDKKDIARTIVARIKENGGSFLQRSSESSVWSIASEKKAVEKTSQALREGLDVRHKTLRPGKLLRKRDTNCDRVGSSTKNHDNLAKEIVKNPPKINEVLQDDVPDLVTDISTTHSFEPIFTFFPQTILNPHCDNVLQI
jgi:hypothetical protein